MKTLRLILGDQLKASHGWYSMVDSDVDYLIAELHQEQYYVRHHVQKIVAFFLAMEAFAHALRQAGHRVIHLTLDETRPYGRLEALLNEQLRQTGADRFEYQRPDEYRLLNQLRSFDPGRSVEVREFDTEHFLVPFEELPTLFKAGQKATLEIFYRRMRRRFGYLMAGDQPEGARWNFDRENRHRLSPAAVEALPEPLCFSHKTGEVLARIERHGVDCIGEIGPTLIWPVTRRESWALLDHFCRICLPRFGTFQDAMTAGGPHCWSLYHSRLSFALNVKMLSPSQVIEQVIRSYRECPGRVELAQVEGFVRQILGWREFVRGIYWVNEGDYSSRNVLEARRGLPSFFWTGETRMNCLRHSIGQSLKHAYAHHIQRLMVIGNFCLLTGIDPDEVDQWYLGVYIDAIEWVEMPNARGMSQFADGGLVASKPYSGSGQYIQRMSDYCQGCDYDVRQRSGEGSCPFNSLYWRFHQRHAARFATNPRLAMVYRNWDRKSGEERAAILAQAESYLERIEGL